MSTAAVHNTNPGCCSVPPVQSSYTPKGTYKKYANFDRVYVTGPERSENALVVVYDIFGFYPQTQQGADLVAETLKTTVYMPDFFEPEKPYPLDRFPPSTDEDKAAFQAFFGGPAHVDTKTAKLIKFGATLKSDGAKHIGVYGFCWGGKIVISSAGKGTPFDAVSIVHPAMLSGDDAAKLTVPLAIYISKDESVEEYNKVLDTISKKPFASKNDSKNYSNMIHGWAAARADLKNEENKKEFEDVYGRLVHFFKNAWA